MTSLNGVTNDYPRDVGIVNMEIYFPSRYVEQSELEVHDGASTGKYTIGLGQTKMGFCSDLEDINSMCLTAVDALIRKTPGVDYADIGRLEVGTETLVDKSKSVKSVLMKLFEGSRNSDVEGVDSTNACYGGTAALFNCVSWVESSYWDGRYAVAVCADIAVYASGNARPTGGAGAVAMLVGPNAGLVLDRGLRATHVEHVYDFYKPNLNSEYPVVDGKLSIECYLRSLDKCYNLYKEKAKKKKKDEEITLETFDAVLFHTPFCKLVQKSLARLFLNDFLCRKNDGNYSDDLVTSFSGRSLDETYADKEIEKAFMTASKPAFEAKTKPSLRVATNVGNMYTPSLYGGLISFLVSKPVDELIGAKVGLFSYGSGLASSFFSLRVSPAAPSPLIETLKKLPERLESRTKVPPATFEKAMALRERVHHTAPYQPTDDPGCLFPGTWYLERVDELHRRSYSKSGLKLNGHTN